MARRKRLFQLGEFTSAAGISLPWKIECDALSPEEWDCIAFALSQKLPPFRYLFGVPTGGYPLAKAMSKYINMSVERFLIVDDVWTTGKSLYKFRNEICWTEDWIGAVAFARGPYPDHRITTFCEMR